jgi:hypothetical protein
MQTNNIGKITIVCKDIMCELESDGRLALGPERAVD